ncbi:MAG TPA: PSD1 and planctomycete cytochrome C domain-containing protein [Pirellulaceae bacterium]|nr:PSD1 and planctomycete cytochrome C domain-containing protein [Pirellulaceae bacterium]HMO91343.1 PSD1 and planctomycete cytochrome C domain-containing protein [Pirellulaceae bacterium]HMP70265.1 PSD1 and planctomycete cytochrome C domain-containing protein [Pirellulaceae bacterium]
MPHIRYGLVPRIISVVLTAVGLLTVTCDFGFVSETISDNNVRFERDIRPILSENCFACHGFDQESREADLRLDIAEDGLSRVVVAGKPEQSLLFQRIVAADRYTRMPPPGSHRELKPEQIELIRRWIVEGGEFGAHWSLIPPRRPALPRLPAELVPESGNEIDLFIREPLLKLGIAPAAEADRFTLIRRAYLDLLGLPPSADEILQFVNDPDPQAYENLIKRILDSPHFGERMALDWLDAARYADTNGYSIDGGRHIWLWRDWVIQAFNDNLPYDQFLREQLAGDLLPDPSVSQLVATGFQRNAMVTHEGGTIPEENLANYNADRLKTFGEAMLGLTLACAQCHDHKYDPITQEEYYQLTAYFNTLDDRGLDGDGGVNPVPSIHAPTVLKTDELPQIQARINELESKLATIDELLLFRWEELQQKRLELRGRDFQLYPVEVLNVTTPNMGSGFDIEGQKGVRISAGAWMSAFDMALKLPEVTEPIQGIRVTFYPVDGMANNGWGHGTRKQTVVAGEHESEIAKGTFILTGFSVTADQTRSDQVNLHQLARIKTVTASCWDDAFPPRATLDPRNPTGWSPELITEGPVHFTITLDEPINVAQTPYLVLQLNFGFGQSMLPAKFDLEVFTGNDVDTDLPRHIEQLLSNPAETRSGDERQLLWQYCAADSMELWHARIELENLRERQRVLTEAFPTMVMRENEKPRQTFVFNRGDYSQPLHQVSVGVPSSLPALPADSAANRLGLADWVTMDSNPLTARVAVNRFWLLLFGRGIVSTPADFGSQGSWPSHPELLDWLAVEFRESGWDVKRLMYLLTTSATYRQSSASDAVDLEQDAQNERLARGARFRLPAELIRDAALKTSGLLVARLGGPSVNPYTPGDPWREVSHYGSTPATAQIFVQDHGEKLYRRSLYTYWKRTAPPTNMTIFDAPNREVCVIGRPATTTPLQALVLLNDVQFVEATRAFAERIIKRDGNDHTRLAWACLECLGRPASERELIILHAALTRERDRYQRNPESAELYLSNGESPRDASIEVGEHAAWAMIASLLFNHSEFITRH